MEKSKKTSLANLGLLLVAIIWAGGFVVTKNTLDIIDPIYLTFLRFAMATVLTGFIFRKKLKNIKKSDLRAGFIIGTFMFFGFITQTVGLQYTTVSNQAFLTASSVVIVPFILWAITKKKPDTYELLASILCIIGIGILSLKEGFTIGLGDSLTLMCAVFFACNIIAIGKFSKNHDPMLLTVLQFATVTILSFITCLVLRIPFKPINMTIFKSISYMAVFSTIIAFGIQNIAQRYTSSTNTAILLSLESVFGTIFSIIFLKEELTARLFIGCFIMFMGILTAQTKWKFLRKA